MQSDSPPLPMRLLALFLFASATASAQPAADILAQNAGYETGLQLVEQDATFSFERFRDGFNAGLRGDSTEIAYALGLRAGLGLRQQQQEDPATGINSDLFLAGIQSGLRGEPARYAADVVARATAAYNDDLLLRQLQNEARTDPGARRRLAEARRNGETAARFLADAAGMPGVQASASGMLSLVTRTGRGARPTMADQVEIRYVGTLPDGTEFDRSQGTAPTTLPVSAVVPGFAEALVLMRPGERRTVWLPPNLAYGVQGAPGPGGQGGIPPNSALEFDLTLVRVLPADAGM